MAASSNLLTVVEFTLHAVSCTCTCTCPHESTNGFKVYMHIIHWDRDFLTQILLGIRGREFFFLKKNGRCMVQYVHIHVRVSSQWMNKSPTPKISRQSTEHWTLKGGVFFKKKSYNHKQGCTGLVHVPYLLHWFDLVDFIPCQDIHVNL